MPQPCRRELRPYAKPQPLFALTAFVFAASVPAVLLSPMVDAAHDHGLKVWAHATLFPARPSDVVRAGANVVSHADMCAWESVDSLPDGPRRLGDTVLGSRDRLDDVTPVLEEMARRGTILDPTLTVYGESCESCGWRSPAIAEIAAQIVRRAHRLGVPIVAGHDGSDLALLHVELEQLVSEGGLSPLEALASATSIAARAIRWKTGSAGWRRASRPSSSSSTPTRASASRTSAGSRW